jgi:hypothetical protein
MIDTYAIDKSRPMTGIKSRNRETIVKSPIIATRDRDDINLLAVRIYHGKCVEAYDAGLADVEADGIPGWWR